MMSNRDIQHSNEFFKKFYQNQASKITEQIRNQFSTNNDRTNYASEEPEFPKLTANIEALTNHMKDTLKNDKLCNTKINSKYDNGDYERELTKAEKSYVTHEFRNGLVDTRAENLNIIPFNSKDPLHSVTSFEDLKLKPELLNGISSLGFRKPSGIQERALPMLLETEPRHMIAQSQSGTGKTATFLLTMLSKININDTFCQCLCMAPTRELVTQIAEVATSMSRFMPNIKISCAIKGQAQSVLQGEVDSQIVIGTPGTLKFWTTENTSIYINPKKLRVFVLDEADIMIDNSEFLNIANRIKSKLTNNCQILLFSATYDTDVMDFAHKFVPNPTEITVKPQELNLKNIKQFYIKMNSPEEKYPTLIDIYGKKSMGQCIIFCESRKMALHLQKQLEKDSHLSSLLTGELDVLTREQEIRDFRAGKSRVLIATNLCSRGIDIPQVNLIINWEMPRNRDGRPDPETYLHRIGRSGRFGKTGLTINFIVTDDDMQIQKKIIEVYGGHIEEMKDIAVVATI